MTPQVADWKPRSATTRFDSRASMPRPARSLQLVPFLPFDSAPWLPSLLSHLNALETAGRNIPGVGDLTIAPATANRLRRLLTIVPGQDMPEPTLAPFSGGGLALSWNIGERELTFAAYPENDSFVFVRTDDNDEAADDGTITLDQTNRLSEVITAFLSNPAR